ncbi:uncharacterized protein LOC120266480 [Dioscorea cayenensis subsp. rotundata]|uniref:Uncharacterized protein LOC120266480 n=1 Tax=Dioscorea cayennensis subsp. rotundata TaxID=55577 RepID=A0AB40BTZ9_DIOCR|nr:uncharacterized protein LOC120266480 [Dioscorea cayenensis subsp. rotundata]
MALALPCPTLGFTSHRCVLATIAPSTGSLSIAKQWRRMNGCGLAFELWSRPRSLDLLVVRSSADGGSGGGGDGGLAIRWEDWLKLPQKQAGAVSLSDVVWPSAGAFLAMAALGRMDQMVASKGISFTVAPLGAVCAVLFATPNSPAAQKYNMFLAQIGCAAFGVLAFLIFGPGWLARAAALAASIAFMIVTGSTHPPAASLPIMFIDGAKFHHLQFWYALFPGATGCILLCLIQELVNYLKANYKF